MIIRGSTFALPALCLSWASPFLQGWVSCPEHLQQTLHLDSEHSTSELPFPTEQVKRVAIIGAGTSGLAALKTFVHDIPKPEGQRWEIELFEQRDGLGGVWLVSSTFLRSSRFQTDQLVYRCRLPDDGSARYPHVPQTPLYPHLHTNTPAPTSNHQLLHLPNPLVKC